MDITRRNFFMGALASAAMPAVARARTAGGKDPDLSVFLSDIHVASAGIKTEWGKQPDYQNAYFMKAVDEILAMRPLPARVVVFGDVALWFGWHQDYEQSSPGFKRLKDAGVDVFVTTGNHDHREPLFKHHPHQAEITPVPGRFVSVIGLGSADLFLMDTLKENPAGEGTKNAVDGALDEAQQQWLLQAAKAAKRPFFVGAHHDADEVKMGKEKLMYALERFPLFAGYICGHHHRYFRKWYHNGYSNRHVSRLVCLPSTGWWGDIGYAVMRTFPDRAELRLVENDFFFPRPLAKGEARPPEWDDIIAENRGSVSVFRY